MKVATIIKTGEQVEIVSVNGGWTTIRGMNSGVESKVRNSALSDHTEISGTTAKLAKAQKAEKTEKAPRQPREKKPLAERQNGVVESLYLQFYQPYQAVRKDGTKIRSMDKGDSLAIELRGMSLEEVYKFAASAVGHSVADLKNRFEHLNNGMQRMSLGNMIRKHMKEAA